MGAQKPAGGRGVSYLRYVKVIGTMHVSPESRREVMETILRERPSAVAIELDRLRFHSLNASVKPELKEALRLGRGGLVQYVLAKVEEKLGEEFGMMPGGEMRGAVEAAALLGVPLYLIDEDIRLITSKLLAAPLREKLFLLLEALAVFLPIGAVSEEGNPMEDFKLMMTRFKLRYPYLFHVLVEERNEVMARNLMRIVDELLTREAKPRVIAVVGLGHKSGIERILNSHSPPSYV